MCCFGMHQAGDEGMEFVKKPTTFLTNADEIGKALSEKCMGTHKHIRLLNGRASRAEVYPQELCFRIIQGLLKQMRRDNRIQVGGVGCTMPEDDIDMGLINPDECKAWDDTTGEELPWEGVLAARKEEMIGVHKHKIY